MKKAIWLLMLLSIVKLSNGQSLQFTFADSTVLPADPAGFLHGISGIEYLTARDQWHWTSDRGTYFVFDSIKSIRDFAKMDKKMQRKLTTLWFESIRFDPLTGTFFFAVENDYKPSWGNAQATTYVAFYDSYPPKKAEPGYLIAPMPLPADNKGIEGIAITPSGNVWVAPEAGWTGETEIGQDTIHFLRFKKTFSGYAPGGQFSYVIDRSGCPYGTTETRGGISEILSVDENRLLVLERCFDNGEKGSKKIKAKLWQVTVSGDHLKKDKEPAFDFKTGMSFHADNLEAMSWWKMQNGKRQLVLVSDDNPGDNNKQRTQIILLKEK